MRGIEFLSGELTGSRRRLLLPGQPGKLATGKKVKKLLGLMNIQSRALSAVYNAITLCEFGGSAGKEKIDFLMSGVGG